MKDYMRSFWAFELPDMIIEQLLVGLRGLKILYPHLKWVKPDNIHLTLHFLGEISSRDLEKQAQEFEPVLTNQQPFPVSLGQIGVFPHWSDPRVLWMGLEGSQKPLNDLHKVTGGILRQLGYTLESRGYSPHITLARIKDTSRGYRLEQDRINQCTPQNNEIFLLEKLTLFTSRLGPDGPQYTPWYSCQLKKHN